MLRRIKKSLSLYRTLQITHNMTHGQQIAKTIIAQLGGNKFIAMTGAKNFLCADITESNPNAWLRMDLPTNKAKVNRLKITLNADDTYTMSFYHQRIDKNFNVVTKNEIEHAGIYADMLCFLFTKVTGMFTSL